MIKTDKLIVCVAPCGSFMMKDANPNMPIQPNEIAEEVYRAWNEGASIVHIHARDEEGKATTNPAVFADITRRIREKGCDIIIEFSTSPGRGPTATVDDGLRVLEASPEMSSIDVGVVVFMQGNEERLSLWTRSFDERITRAACERGIKPEFEIYGVGGIGDVEYITQKIPVPGPLWFNFVLDQQKTAQCATRFTPKNLINWVDQLPENAMFMAMGVGATEIKAVVQAMLLGGHARVGFEDNCYFKRGVLATSNAELVTRAVRVGADLGRPVCSPDEARQLLGIPRLQK